MQPKIFHEMLDSIKTRMQPLNIQIMPILLNLYQDHNVILEGLRAQRPDRVEKSFQSHTEILLGQIREEIQICKARRKRAKKFQKYLVVY